MIIDLLLFVFVGIVCVWAWNYIHQNDNEIEIAGTILIYTQDGEAYLFLDTELTPDELSKKSEVVFKIETRK